MNAAITVLTCAGTWLIVSLVVGILVGKFIHAGSGGRP